MLKYDKSEEHRAQVTSAAVYLAAAYIDGIEKIPKPKEFVDAATRVLKTLEEWYQELIANSKTEQPESERTKEERE